MNEPEAAPQTCPKCPAELLHAERQGMVIELCPACRGLWLDPGELSTLLGLYRRIDLEQGSPSGAKCVRGGEELTRITFPGTEVHVEVCPDCRGFWLDAGVLELLQRGFADLLAHDDPDLSERARALLTEVERAETQRFSCPKCKAKLWHLEREGTVVEMCSDCEGLWFDAGELTVLLGVYRELAPASGAGTGLLCLRCGADLREHPFPGTEILVDTCTDCRGVWLDRGEFDQLKQSVAHLIQSEQQTFSERAEQILDGLDLAAQERARCPKCEGAWEESSVSSVRVERCTGCRGTWLDSGDLTRVLGVSRKIKARRDGEYTELDCLRCPGESLIEIAYPQTDVPIDICPDCRGVFLDEGELEKLAAAVRPA